MLYTYDKLKTKSEIMDYDQGLDHGNPWTEDPSGYCLECYEETDTVFCSKKCYNKFNWIVNDELD